MPLRFDLGVMENRVLLLTNWHALSTTRAGAVPEFSFRGRGRGAKDYVPARTLRARNRTHFRHGYAARLRALEALGLFECSLDSRAIWALFLSILIKHWILKSIVDPILGGRNRHPPPPLWIRHWSGSFQIPGRAIRNVQHRVFSDGRNISLVNSF